MAVRTPDRVTIETGRGTFDRFSALQIVNDIEGRSEAIMETGDDGSGADLYDIVKPGELFTVRLNGRPRLTGRAEVNDITGDADSGVKLKLTLRTKLADARYCNADPKLKMKDATIKTFILALYAKLGYVESDFVFNIGSERDLMTGVVKGHKAPVDIAPAKADSMKINPNETIFAAAERQLKRLHVQQWEAPDGRIMIGAPDDEQSPLFRFQSRRGRDAQGNNVIGFQRGLDWSEVPGAMAIYGKSQVGDGTGDVSFKDVKGVSIDPDLNAVRLRNGHFYRPVHMQNEWAKTQAAVDAIAARERSLRSRSKDTWTVKVDGWTYWDGSTSTPYATDTTADVDVLTGPQGRYLIHKVGMTYGVDQRASTMIGIVAAGIWAI